MQEKQGILAGGSLNSTKTGAADINMCVCVCVDIYVGSVCRTGIEDFYLIPKHEVLNTKGLCLLIKSIKSIKTSSFEVLHTDLLGL